MTGTDGDGSDNEGRPSDIEGNPADRPTLPDSPAETPTDAVMVGSPTDTEIAGTATEAEISGVAACEPRKRLELATPELPSLDEDVEVAVGMV